MKLLKSNFYFCSDCIIQMNSSNKWLLIEFGSSIYSPTRQEWCSLLLLFALLWWRNYLSTHPKKLLLFYPYETTISNIDKFHVYSISSFIKAFPEKFPFYKLYTANTNVIPCSRTVRHACHWRIRRWWWN